MPCAYFSPEDHLAERLVQLIRQEKKVIRAAVYAFTNREIAHALVQAKKRGVEVDLIIDPFSLVRKHPAIHQLIDGGVKVWIWNPKQQPGQNSSAKPDSKRSNVPLMHDKFCLFGDQTVWTGSFNFTYEANYRNEENAVVIQDINIAKKFHEKFKKIQTQSTIEYKEFFKTIFE